MMVVLEEMGEIALQNPDGLFDISPVVLMVLMEVEELKYLALLWQLALEVLIH